jgi:hypothetical protein
MALQNADDTLRPFEWLTSPSSLQEVLATIPDGNKQALHIGSGSSTVGEFLVEELSYNRVLDVDKDEETLQRMKQRWYEKCANTGVEASRLQHVIVDFTTSRIKSAEDASFSLVLDKSTLDCTLCSDNATAALLIEVYRCLAVGGIYLLISFHEKDLLLPLLQDLPGAEWEVTCQTMARQVEKLEGVHSNKDISTINDDTQQLHPPLNVLLARKGEGQEHHCLSMDDVREHVHRVNDVWFQQSHPLLTRQRQQELQMSFAEPLPLQEAYQHLFTEAEREHLTYDLFLEDWQFFYKQWEERQRDGLDENASSASVYTSRESLRISYEMALEFLTEMQ